MGGNDSWITRVPVDGSKQEKLDVDTSFWSYEYGTVWDGKLYLFGTYPETVSRDSSDLLIPAAMVYDLHAGQIIATYDGEYLNMRGAQMAMNNAGQEQKLESDTPSGSKKQLVGTIIGVAAFFLLLMMLAALKTI